LPEQQVRRKLLPEQQVRRKLLPLRPQRDINEWSLNGTREGECEECAYCSFSGVFA
jgi:hypothetical protein